RATQRSSLFDVVLLLGLAVVFYLYLPQETVREMMADPPGASGLTGEPQEGQQAPPPPDGGGGSSNEPLAGSTGNESQDNPFPFESSQQDDPKPVAVVIFRDDYDSPDGYYYFRQTAFSQFN